MTEESHDEHESPSTNQGETAFSTSEMMSLPDVIKPASDKTSKFTVIFDTYDWRDMHWHAPANFIMYTDGSWTSYATRVAHNKRSSMLIRYGLYIVARYTETRDGPVIYSREYTIADLGYNDGRDSHYASGVDAGIAEHMNNIHFISCTRYFRPV